MLRLAAVGMYSTLVTPSRWSNDWKLLSNNASVPETVTVELGESSRFPDVLREDPKRRKRDPAGRR
jgi:hypothetical protein